MANQFYHATASLNSYVGSHKLLSECFSRLFNGDDLWISSLGVATVLSYYLCCCCCRCRLLERNCKNICSASL